jgi:ketosteroid isomerase-like protein
VAGTWERLAGDRMMSTSMCLTSLVLLLGPLLGDSGLCAQTAATDSSQIHQLGRQFSAAYVRGDAAAMADLYTADAVIFPERSEWITGREAIRRYWTLGPGRRITRHVVTPSRIIVNGRHAYDYGLFEIAGERDGIAWGPSRGKYVVVWRRENGGWRMQLDIWNSNAEPGS